MGAPDIPAAAARPRDDDPTMATPWPAAPVTTASRATFFRNLSTELGVLVAFCCSAMLLTYLGYHYDHPGGLPFEKFHPATLILIVAFGFLLAEIGPSTVSAQMIKYHPLALIYILCTFYYALYVTLIVARPVSFILDTLVVPVVAWVLLFRTEPARLNRYARYIHIVMAINAVLGIAESVFGFHLIPIYTGGELLNYEEARSTALLGHPLQNSAIAAIYALLLLTGPRGNLRWSLALPLFCLQLLSLPAFGGRTATVLLGLLMALWILKKFVFVLLGNRFPIKMIVWASLGLPAAAVIGLQLSETTYFAKFIDRFIDDAGSAETRVRMFRLFDGFSWGDLLIGPDPAMLSYLQYVEGTEIGIESFPIAYILSSGIFAASLIFIGLTLFVIDIARLVCLRSLMAVAMFIALNASSTGLSSKGIAFLLLIIIIMCMEGAERDSRLSRKRRDFNHQALGRTAPAGAGRSSLQPG
ncbi:hypothetical protein FV218_01730 [Methylobacterium sp. WL69]|uniref:VpsF family polysaccharide biosynthesis protein n=1 Tax=Methylobacterium sp. WL69 TaxID=2603893 RepID=UPI0011CC122C|nr:VpsF family polysaccharide biosynthesis protein [Methylobacterium sp. WL69]TXM78847.1 hypothetical protein FV218_01730 [Methylobacterium sp. WL69]